MSDVDIVERLRTLKYLSNFQYAVVQDAAAEIEELRAQIAASHALAEKRTTIAQRLKVKQ